MKDLFSTGLKLPEKLSKLCANVCLAITILLLIIIIIIIYYSEYLALFIQTTQGMFAVAAIKG